MDIFVGVLIQEVDVRLIGVVLFNLEAAHSFPRFEGAGTIPQSDVKVVKVDQDAGDGGTRLRCDGDSSGFCRSDRPPATTAQSAFEPMSL